MEEKKIVSIEDRIPKLKEARKKKANRRLIIYLSVFFLLIAFIIYIQSPLSNIKKIDVAGNKVLKVEEVTALSGVALKDNLWILNRSTIKKELEEHPLIESASVKRSLPNTLEINIQEAGIIGYIHESEKYIPVLVDGSIIKKVTIKNKGDGPLLNNFKEEAYLIEIASELNKIPTDIYNLISEVSWQPSKKNKTKIVLYMNDGFVVKATIRDLASKMKAYPSIIAQLNPKEKGIIHMGVGTYFEKTTKEK